MMSKDKPPGRESSPKGGGGVAGGFSETSHN